MGGAILPRLGASVGKGAGQDGPAHHAYRAPALAAFVLLWATAVRADPPPAPPAPPAHDLAAMVPASFEMFVSFDGLAERRRALAASPFWQGLVKTRLHKAVAGSPEYADFERVRRDWRTAFGMSLEESLDGIVGDRVAVALRTRPPKVPAPGEPADAGGAGEDGVLLGRAASERLLAETVAKLVSIVKGHGKPVIETDVGGWRFHSFDGQTLAVRGYHWAAADSPQILGELIDPADPKSAARSLAADPAFKAAMAALPAGAFGRAFADFGRLLAKQPPALPDSPDARFRAVLATVSTGAAALYADAGRLRVEFRLAAARSEGFHPLLSAVLGGGSAEPAIARLLPADAVLAAGWRLDAATLRKGLEEAVPEFRTNERLALAAEAFARMYADRLGPELSVFARRSGPVPSLVKPPTLGVAAQLRDPSAAATLRTTLGVLLSFANDGLKGEGIQLSVRETEHRGVTIATVDLAPLLNAKKLGMLAGLVRPSFAVIGGDRAGGHAVLASHDSLIKAMIDLSADGSVPAAGAGSATVGRLSDSPAAPPAGSGSAEPAALPRERTGWLTVSAAGVADMLNENLLALSAIHPSGLLEGGRRWEMIIEVVRLFDHLEVAAVNAGGREYRLTALVKVGS